MNRRSLIGMLLGVSPMKFSGNGVGFQNPPVGNQGTITRPAFKSDNYVPGVSGWSIFRNGDVEFNSGTFRGTITAGVFEGTDFIINPLGAFFYSGAPATGNLIASIANADGPNDGEGNKFFAGFVSYDNVDGTFIQISNGTMVTGFMANQPAGFLPEVGFSVGNDSLVLESGQQPNPAQFNQASLELRPRDGTLGFTGGISLFGGSVEIDDNESGGQLLTVKNTHATPSNSNVEIECGGGSNDNALGIMSIGDAFNRIKFTTAPAMLFGSGAAAQDAQMYRAAAGQIATDVLVANNGGSPEVYQSLGLPGITGWTSDRGRFRLAPDGEVEIDIILHSNAVAHASSITSYPNTLPVAYRPAFNRVYPLGIDTTITAGDPYPRLAISTAGVVRIAIPSVTAVTTEIGGNIRMPLD